MSIRRRAPVAARLASHLAVWTVVLVPMIAELSRGWRPFGDEAAISSRAYQVLSLHPPLVGLTSAASSLGHVVFDPGPLMFFLLAVPVHLDPAQGLLWGSALFGCAALSVAVEAAWTVGRWIGASAVVFIALDLLWLTPAVFERLTWNAYFPVPFFIAALALTWAVAAGSPGWWPVLVLVASVAAQSHLLFLVPAAALSVLALAFALHSAAPPRRLRWLGTGLVVGLLCWLAPLIQQMTGHPGNLTALARSGGGHATLGFGFALRLVGLADSLHPVWLTHLPTAFSPLAALEKGHPPWYGELVLGLLVVITVVALATGRRALGALAAVGVVSSAGLAVSFAIFPVSNVISLGYLVDSLWVLGILTWVVAGWSAFVAATAVLRRTRWAADAGSSPGRPALIPWVSAGAVFAGLVVVAVFGIRPAATRPREINWNGRDVALTARVATDVERVVARGPVAVTIGPLSRSDFLAMTWVDEAVGFRLEADGWDPGLSGIGLSGIATAYTGLAEPPHAQWPRVHVQLRGDHVVAVVGPSGRRDAPPLHR